MKANCARCQAEYERDSELDAIFCLYCRTKSEVKTSEVLWAVCLVFGLCALGLFIPFLLGPLKFGTDGSGNFIIPSKGGGRAFASPISLLIGNLVIGLSSLTLLYLSAHFKRKLVELKIKLSEMKDVRNSSFN
jgi:DNA-directed RNA polymerase subunit RPC12/RpoP